MSRRSSLISLVLLWSISIAICLAPTSIAGQDTRRAEPSAAHGHHAHTHHADTRPTLLPGLGDWRHSISTRVPRAQQFFDQGLRLAYAFNHDEAARSFAEAARLDPTCGMCWWVWRTPWVPTSIFP